MSYNITSWKTKRLENLVIPLWTFHVSGKQDWHPRGVNVVNPDTMEVVLDCGCEQQIRGHLADEQLTVTAFQMAGEGSGTFLNYILEPALRESRGELEAVLIWEGGDSVSRLIVKDGVVTNEQVEL